MKRYRLMRRALRELNEIVAYVAADNPVAALRVRDWVFDACEKLGRQPGMGHRGPDITSADVRFWNIRGRFLIVYRDTTRPIEILRIFRAGRDVTTALR
jgi:plasmid stabilization system protein ParE